MGEIGTRIIGEYKVAFTIKAKLVNSKFRFPNMMP